MNREGSKDPASPHPFSVADVTLPQAFSQHAPSPPYGNVTPMGVGGTSTFSNNILGPFYTSTCVSSSTTANSTPRGGSHVQLPLAYLPGPNNSNSRRFPQPGLFSGLASGIQDASDAFTTVATCRTQHANALAFSNHRPNRLASASFSMDPYVPSIISVFNFPEVKKPTGGKLSAGFATSGRAAPGILKAKASVGLPPARIQFSPFNGFGSKEKLISVGDCLKVWDLEPLTLSMSEVPTRLNSPENTPATTHPNSGSGSLQVLAVAGENAGEHIGNSHSHAAEASDSNQFNWGLPELMFEACRYCNKPDYGSGSYSASLRPAAAFTCCDWGTENTVLTGCTDTTVSVWDLAQECSADQLIAHDKAVLDVAWFPNAGSRTFISGGADGSVRAFDLRTKGKCEVKFEAEDLQPVLRCTINPHDPNLVAICLADSTETFVVDLRYTGSAISLQRGQAPSTNFLQSPHQALGPAGPINAAVWNPDNWSQVVTCSEDATLSLYDVHSPQQPLGTIQATSAINCCAVSPLSTQGDAHTGAGGYHAIAYSTEESVEVVMVSTGGNGGGASRAALAAPTERRRGSTQLHSPPPGLSVLGTGGLAAGSPSPRNIMLGHATLSPATTPATPRARDE